MDRGGVRGSTHKPAASSERTKMLFATALNGVCMFYSPPPPPALDPNDMMATKAREIRSHWLHGEAQRQRRMLYYGKTVSGEIWPSFAFVISPTTTTYYHHHQAPPGSEWRSGKIKKATTLSLARLPGRGSDCRFVQHLSSCLLLGGGSDHMYY